MRCKDNEVIVFEFPAVVADIEVDKVTDEAVTVPAVSKSEKWRRIARVCFSVSNLPLMAYLIVH